MEIINNAYFINKKYNLCDYLKLPQVISSELQKLGTLDEPRWQHVDDNINEPVECVTHCLSVCIV